MKQLLESPESSKGPLSNNPFGLEMDTILVCSWLLDTPGWSPGRRRLVENQGELWGKEITGQDLSVENWDVYHWLKTIITTEPHINIRDGELKDLLTWLNANRSSTDLNSVFPNCFWDVVYWKLCNLFTFEHG